MTICGIIYLGMKQNRFLPTTRAEMKASGWDSVDIVFVTGDAYIDHYSFAMASLGRVLEDRGFKVAILSQPDWRSCEPWRQFGRPRLFFGISAGNMDMYARFFTRKEIKTVAPIIKDRRAHLRKVYHNGIKWE